LIVYSSTKERKKQEGIKAGTMKDFFTTPIRPIEVFTVGVMVAMSIVAFYLAREAKK
jgi:hypothetical protein